MNLNYIKVIEQLGYQVYPNDNISLINIFDQNKKELDKNFDYMNKEVLFVSFTSKDGKEIRVFNHPFVTIKVSDDLFISAYQYSDYDTIKTNHDQEIHNSFYIDVKNKGKLYSILIELSKRNDGLNSVEVNISRKLDTKWDEMYEIVGNKLSIRQNDEGSIVNIVGNDNPLYTIDYKDCTMVNYKNIIFNHINDVNELKDNSNLKEGLNMILPAMESLIEELLTDWKEKNTTKKLLKNKLDK